MPIADLPSETAEIVGLKVVAGDSWAIEVQFAALDEDEFSHARTLGGTRPFARADLGGSGADGAEHLVGRRPRVDRTGEDAVLEFVPAFTGGDLPGPLLQTTRDDLAQFLA